MYKYSPLERMLDQRCQLTPCSICDAHDMAHDARCLRCDLCQCTQIWEVYESQGNQEKGRRRSNHTSKPGSATNSEQHLSSADPKSVQEMHTNCFTYTLPKASACLSGDQPEVPSMVPTSSVEWKVHTTHNTHTPSAYSDSPRVQTRPFLTQVKNA